MANWSNPILTSSYVNFLAEVKARDDDAGTQFSVGTPTNMPTGAVKWDTALNRWQKWSGSAWGELTATYSLTNVTANGSLSVTGNSTFGDSSADTVTSNAATWTFANATAIAGALTFSGAIGFTGSVTIGDAIGDSVIINSGTLSIPNGLTVSGGTANFSALQLGGSTVISAGSANVLTNKTVDFSVGGNVLKVNGNTITATAGAGTITFPAATDQVVCRDTTDTLTNKTLTGPVLNGTISGSSVISLANGGTGAITAATALAALGVDISAIGANGYMKIGTLYIQWGTSAAAASVNSPVSITFPVAFPNALWSVVGSAKLASGSAGEAGFAQVSAQSASGATFETFRVSGSGTDTASIMWIAIGN